MQLIKISAFTPEADERAWLSVPHPTLPLLATASSDKKARVYSLQNFALHSTLEKGHKRSVRSVAWKPNVKDGELSIVTGSFDATAGFWRRKEQEQELEERYTEIDFTNGDDNLDEEEHDWEFTLVLEGHDSEIKSVTFSPSGQFLATCSRDKTVWIWEEIGGDGEDEWETVAVLQDHDGDVKHLAWVEIDGEERLASCSFDETIRIYKNDGEDWECFAVLEGHTSTVLGIDWENADTNCKFITSENTIERQSGDIEESISSNPKPTPRIASCSADETIKIWSRESSPVQTSISSKDRIPSTFQPASSGETWICAATLPKVHVGAIYSISWSKKSGRIVSTGNDSQVVVYQEQLVDPQKKGNSDEETGDMIDRNVDEKRTEWVVVTIKEMAHDLYEVNHAIWCGRFDGGRKGEEEMIVTTGDDGQVRAWALNADAAPTKDTIGGQDPSKESETQVT